MTSTAVPERTTVALLATAIDGIPAERVELFGSRMNSEPGGERERTTRVLVASMHVGIASGAHCSAVAETALDLLARAVMLVAGRAIPKHERAAVLARVIAVLSLVQKEP